MKKILAILMILNLILINVNIVDAAKTVCCDKLEDNDNYCIMAENSNKCEINNKLKSYTLSCNQLNNQNCVKGCCVYGDGNCVADKYKIECIDGNGQWSAGSCEINACKPGFCVIGTKNCFFAPTRLKCLMKANEMGVDLSLVNYDADVKSKEECFDKYNILDEVRGCCVSDNGNCEMGTKGETSCFSEGKNFAEKRGCSEINICKEKCFENYGCLDGNVYKFGGNLEGGCGWEKLMEECDETKNKACVKIREESDILIEKAGEEEFYQWLKQGDYIAGSNGNVKGVGCRTIDCKIGNEFYVRNYDIYKGESIKAYIKIISEMLGEKDSRKNGESWCVSPSNPNPPGSRHYVYYCNKGVIEVIPCSIGRIGENGVCDENTVNSFTEAKCVENRWKSYEPKDKGSGENNYPPGLKFYSDGVDFGAPSSGESCGRCGGKSYDFDLCQEKECKYAGDCKYDEGLGAAQGCIGGAVIALVGPKAISYAKEGVGAIAGVGGTAGTAEKVGTMGKVWKGTKSVMGFLYKAASLKAFYDAITGKGEEPKQEEPTQQPDKQQPSNIKEPVWV